MPVLLVSDAPPVALGAASGMPISDSAGVTEYAAIEKPVKSSPTMFPEASTPPFMSNIIAWP